MIEVETQTRRWGNSLGIILPKDIAKKEGLKEKDKIIIIIRKPKAVKVKDIFGKLKMKKPTAQIMKEVDKELDSKFLKGFKI